MAFLVSAVLPLVLQQCDDVYLLPGHERYKLAFVCRACVPMFPAARYFSLWLARHECGRGYFSHGRQLYYEYHGALLQRVFLRRILQQDVGDIVIAGSFPAALYLDMKGSCAWRPNDIDIFVFSRTRLEAILQCYHDVVAGPLSLRLRLQGSKFYGCLSSADVDMFPEATRLRSQIMSWLDGFDFMFNLAPQVQDNLQAIVQYIPAFLLRGIILY